MINTNNNESEVTVKFTLEQAMEAQTECRSKAVTFLYLDVRWGGELTSSLSLCTARNDSLLIV
jgi:heterodisulfide reductase subunit A-like polyferredoxin